MHKTAVDFSDQTISELCQVAQSLVSASVEFEAEPLVSAGLWDLSAGGIGTVG